MTEFINLKKDEFIQLKNSAGLDWIIAGEEENTEITNPDIVCASYDEVSKQEISKEQFTKHVYITYKFILIMCGLLFTVIIIKVNKLATDNEPIQITNNSLNQHQLSIIPYAISISMYSIGIPFVPGIADNIIAGIASGYFSQMFIDSTHSKKIPNKITTFVKTTSTKIKQSVCKIFSRKNK